MRSALPDHYATLGLDPGCAAAQIRAAYRLLAKQLHPDVNGGSPRSLAQTQALNAAYETLSDPERRAEYDRARAARKTPAARAGKTAPNVSKEIHLRLEEFFRGCKLEIRVDDPGNPAGPETCELTVPPDTAPGTRFRVPRCAGGFVVVRVKARPDFRFKPRGSDLRCDLKVSSARARQGGAESVRGATGEYLRVTIPPKVARGEIIRVTGGGLPKTRGGRGDLLVRVLYTPDVHIRRAPLR